MVCRECGAYNPEHLTHCRVCAAKLRDDEPASSAGAEQARPQHSFAKAPSWPSKPYQGTVKRPVYDPPKEAEKAAEVVDKLLDETAEKAAAADRVIPIPTEKHEESVRPVPEAPAVPDAVDAEETEPERTVLRASVFSKTEPDAKKDSSRDKSETRRQTAAAPLSSDDPEVTETPTPAAEAAEASPGASGEKRICSVCGREMLSDAPFCAYCGSHEGLPGNEDFSYVPVKSTRDSRQASKRSKSRKADVQAEEQTAEKQAARPERTVRSSAKEALPEEKPAEEDEDDLLLLPGKSKKKSGLSSRAFVRKSRRDEEEPEDEDEDDSEFDDEEFDDEDDEYEGESSGRGGTILFWVLIALLIGCIVFFGAYIAKRNFGSIGNMFAAITGKESPAPAAQSDDVSTAPAATSIPAYVDDSRMYTADVREDFDAETGTPIYAITVYAPTGSTVKLNTVTELMNGGTMQISRDNQIVLKVPRAAYLPGTPLDSSVISIVPSVTVITAEGESVDLSVPTMTQTVEQLEIVMTSPTSDTVTNTFNNAPITLTGLVGDYTEKVYINGQETTVYLNSDELTSANFRGRFETTYTPLGGDMDETITITATKENAATATKIITIHPYVMQEGTIAITSDPSVKSFGLTAQEDGSLTIEGTAIPNGTVAFTSASAAVTGKSVTCGEDGTFRLPVTVSETGAFRITLTATSDGFTSASADCIVERQPSESSSTFFSKAKTLNSDAHKSILGGSLTSGNFGFVGTVTEIVSGEPYETVKMKLKHGEEVLVTNRSAKNRLDKYDVKKSKQVAGTLMGIDEESGLPHLWVWFVWNK